MTHNSNTSDHLRLQSAAGAEISGGVSGNNVHESTVRRTLLRCCHCDTVNAHYQYLYAIYFQNLPLWCGDCGSFNPQWGFLVTNFSDYRWNTDDSDLHDQLWRNWVNVQFSVEDQNRGAAAGFERTEEIDNNVGRYDRHRHFSYYDWEMDASDLQDQLWQNWVNVQFSVENQNRGAVAGSERTDNNGGSDVRHRHFSYYDWNMDDSDPQDLVWEHWMNLQLSENQNSSAVQRTEEEEEVDNYGGNDYREEIIWKYLTTRDCRKCGNKEEEGEICVICQNEFEEDEVFKRLDCGHDYHYECIYEWLLLKNSCPLCIRTVLPSDFESDFDFYFNYD